MYSPYSSRGGGGGMPPPPPSSSSSSNNNRNINNNNGANNNANSMQPITSQQQQQQDYNNINNNEVMNRSGGLDDHNDAGLAALTSADALGGAFRLDAEAYQQRVYELFDQYTQSNTIHKLDLLDLLEDLGFEVTMDQLQDAVINDLGLGADAGGSGTKKKDKGGGDNGGGGAGVGKGKIPSSFDLEDTMAICLHFYNREDADRKGGDDDTNHLEVVDIQAHSYLVLLFTCSRNPRVQYNIIRPAFLNFKFTPKKMLVSGAASVMCLMCILVLMTLALLWLENIKSDERRNAENYASTFSQFMDQYEYRNGEPLRQAIEGAEFIGSVQVASYVQELLDEEKNLDHAASMMSGSAAIGLRLDQKESDRVLVGVEVALQAGYQAVKSLQNASSSSPTSTAGRMQKGTVGSVSPAVFNAIVLPMLKPHVTATAAQEGWDFVVTNVTSMVGRGASVLHPPTLLTVPTVACVDCNFHADPCATTSLGDEDSVAGYVIEGDDQSDVNDGFTSNGIADSVILSRVNTSGVLTSSGVAAVTISVHMPYLGLTVCFYKPMTSFVQRIKGEVGTYFADKYDTVFKQMSFQMGHNLVRYDRFASASSSAANGFSKGLMTHLTPLDIFGSLRVNCIDGNGCENGNIRTAVAAAVNSCNMTGECNLESTTVDGVDNSSTPVVCAVRSFGFPIVTDSAVILCRSRSAVQRTAIDTLIKAADMANAEHTGSSTASSIIVATRNATTGVITPQANAFTLTADCRAGSDGKQCLRTTPAAQAATSAFSSGRGLTSRYSQSYELLSALFTPTVGHTSSIAPDHRLHVPTFQGYVYLPLLDAVVGIEREVMMARSESYTSILGLAIDINSMANAMAIVPVTRYITFEPTRHYDPKEVCPVGVTCLDRPGYGVTYRSDCSDCSETGLLGPIHSLVALPHCNDISDGFTCTAMISASSLYHEPFNYLKGGAGNIEDGKSYYGEKSLYAPIYVRNISLGILLHFYTNGRQQDANDRIYIAIGVSCALIVIALTVFLVLSRNNLNQVEKEWVQYKKSISNQNADFARVVGDVVPPVYAPLLFVPTSQIAERLNITTIFINFVGFQRHVAEQDADFLHDYISYSFYAMNAVTRYYKMFKVKTFGDNFMIVGGVNKQMATRSAAIRKMVNGDGSVIAATMTGDDKDNLDDNEDASIVRCVEAASVIMQLFSYLFQHNPQHIGFLRKRLKAKQLTEMAMMRIGVATGPTNLIMTRHDGFPFFLALSEFAAVAYKLQQAAKTNSINISADVKKAIIRLGKDSQYEFGKDKTLLHKKIVVSSCLIQKANVPIPKPILSVLRVSRAPCRMFFTEDGSLKAAVAGATNMGTGASTQQMAASEKSSVHSGTNNGLSNAMSSALRRMTGGR